jgi:hypothetical protein
MANLFSAKKMSWIDVSVHTRRAKRLGININIKKGGSTIPTKG